MRYFTQRSWITVADDEVPPALFIALGTLGFWAMRLKRLTLSDEQVREAEAARNHAMRAALAMGCSESQLQTSIASTYSKVDIPTYLEIAADGPVLATLTVSAGLQREFADGFTDFAIEKFGSLDAANAALMGLTPEFHQALDEYEDRHAQNDDWRNALRWKLCQYQVGPRVVPSATRGPDISALFLQPI